MDRTTLDHLEKVYDKEIDGKSCQLHATTMTSLANRGLVELVDERVQSPLGVITSKACRLTDVGRTTYLDSIP